MNFTSTAQVDEGGVCVFDAGDANVVRAEVLVEVVDIRASVLRRLCCTGLRRRSQRRGADGHDEVEDEEVVVLEHEEVFDKEENKLDDHDEGKMKNDHDEENLKNDHDEDEDEERLRRKLEDCNFENFLWI